jgi:DNA replication and repair protein RecF
MFLKSLSLIQFKNHEEQQFSFTSGINCLVGENGVGKTNVLDAIYYLTFCKSYFNPIDSQNILHGEGFFVVQGEFDREGKSEVIHCGLKKGQKKSFKRNKKEYERLADHIGLFPLVMVTPSDTELIHNGSELRRKFIDGVISQFNKSYLDHLLNYNRAVAQRNAFLKRLAEERRTDDATLEVWDMQLEQYGTPIFEARKEFLQGFIPIFQKYYDMLGQGREEVSLDYDSQLTDIALDKLLEENRSKDYRLTYTSVGIHKDDLAFLINGHPLKKFGSQGQQKSFVVALKLAQFDYIKEQKGIKPLILLDDIFDKLDPSRVKALLQLVSEDHFGQIFVTDANKERMNELFDDIHAQTQVTLIQ